MHVVGTGVFAASAIVLMALGAQAGPSFDCHTHKGLTEQVICANRELGDMDGEMSKEYFDLINDESMRSDTRAWAKDSQRAWLRERNGCGANIDCLRAVYQRRLNELTGTHYGH
jgi:uncharacterized protein